MGYIVTNSDRLALIELLNTTPTLNLKASLERGTKSQTQWILQAPNPKDKTQYITNGSSITEVINKWFIQMEEINGVPMEREVWTSLWDSKMDLVTEDE